ncbi:MAG TPA: hypothetical protein VKZ18_03205 [Polyangia bacterium]|nr:hypothetical protein [Polyangia bacterium]
MGSRRSIARATIAALALAGCSYTYVQEGWDTLPTVFPRPGSSVVTLATFKVSTTLHHQESTLWFSNGGESLVKVETTGSSCYDLDVTTCKVSARWRCPPREVGVPADPAGEMIGPVRFSAGEGRTSLVAADTTTGRTWTAATSFGPIASVVTVPAARRVVVVTSAGAILAYDVDANQVVACR